MLIRIHDNRWIILDQITVPEEEAVKKAFSVEHPRARFITGAGFFDGWIRKYNARYKRLSRAFLGDLVRLCKTRGFPYQISDERIDNRIPAPDPETIGADYLNGITLEEYQIRAIRAACKSEVGLISAPTGAGKSELMAGICKAMNCKTVIMGDMKIIIKQIKERLELRDVAGEVGLFYAGQRPNGQQIIVGSIQSISVPSKPKKTEKDTSKSYARKIKSYQTRRKNARVLRNLISDCGLLLVDEADKATNKQWHDLFFKVYEGRRKYGLSGTFFDPDKPVEAITLRENLGSIISEVSRDEVQSRGRIIPVEYVAIAFGDPLGTKDKAALDIAENECIVNNPEFHNLVKNICELETRGNSDTGILVLVDKRNLGFALESIIPNSVFICGDDSMTSRTEAIESFEKRETRVLIGSKIVERGLDLEGGCEVCIIATGGKSSAKFNQKIGRAVRLNKKGKSKVYDFYFMCNSYLYAHSRNRIKDIVAMGYPAKVVFKEGAVDAAKFVKSRFRRPKRRLKK